ncbi:aldehyde dehydrogenase [Choiromyces venosus 120613-1]|uniref:Aldehyde dehydrogenase n=1 Tax=Choiromyces venosus 120613-1 TaxID=1336337 RepID=A0A3N4JJZ0_9PEZI|nr:aldehyde dehydrogenase [Choiromyces venosus 120613-1]
MTSHLLIPFSSTPVESIAPTVSRLQNTFTSLKTHPFEYREEQLRKLYWGVKDNEQRLVQALKADLGKPYFEAMVTEVDWIGIEILYILKNLRKWAADDKMELPFLHRLVLSPCIRKEPMGTVLVIGAFNYPALLALIPLIGVIAAGNTAVIKPSEQAPNAAAIITRILESSLDPEAYAVINGGIPESTELLNQKFDKICYTGNAAVGRIIATAAAKHLTPAILELGGLNPCIITKSADAKLAAKRIAWGKVHNSGQVCLCPNYVIIHPSLETEFVGAFIQTLKKFFPEGASKSPDLARIVNKRHYHRITELLNKTKGTILYGGERDESKLFIEPTLVKITSTEDSLLSEEIFGPLLPMLVVEDLDKMISVARQVGDCPLALYIFSGEKEEEEKILKNIRSGGATINDVFFHAAIPSIAFGGVGESGTGSYRGKASFDAFVHRRPVVNQPLWMEGQLRMRYPPFTPKKLDLMRKASGSAKPNFGRDGKLLRRSLISWILLLGAYSRKGAVFRYLLLMTGKKHTHPPFVVLVPRE